jgi:glycerophosphoryl diester phosphodiesterase
MLIGLAMAAAAAQIEVHGHRGARARFPENSIPAFEHALAVGADYLELDLGVTIPTFDEVVALVKRRKSRVRLNVETKIFPEHPEATIGPAQFARLVVESLRSHGLLGRTVLQSFDPRTLVEARRLAPKLRRSILVEKEGADMVALARETGAGIVSPSWKLLNVEGVARLRAAGLKILPWAANDEEAWGKLRALGVDGIITDDPERLIAFLRRGP